MAGLGLLGNGRGTRRKLGGGGKKRPVGMPERGSFMRPVTYRHDGAEYLLEVWSSPWKWCIRLKSDGRCFYGASELEAWRVFIKAIDPSVEEVTI
jgi:hypothetical protein